MGIEGVVLADHPATLPQNLDLCHAVAGRAGVGVVAPDVKGDLRRPLEHRAHDRTVGAVAQLEVLVPRGVDATGAHRLEDVPTVEGGRGEHRGPQVAFDDRILLRVRGELVVVELGARGDAPALVQRLDHPGKKIIVPRAEELDHRNLSAAGFVQVGEVVEVISVVESRVVEGGDLVVAHQPVVSAWQVHA
jgi:hypothetical protein